MKTGMTQGNTDLRQGMLNLVERVEREQLLKFDFIARTNSLKFVTNPETNVTMLKVPDEGAFAANDNFHSQVRVYSDIPADYYGRCRKEFITVNDTQRNLLDLQVNHWLETSKNKKGDGDQRMVRTMDGVARAFLSSRYRRLDNHDLVYRLLPILNDIKNLDIASAEITDTRLYIKLVSRDLWAEVGVGDVVQVGVCIQNSEIGHGSLEAIPYSIRKRCENGQKHTTFGMRKNHTGARLDVGNEEILNLFQDDTLKADDEAFWLQFRDVVKASLTDTMLNKIVSQMKEAAGIKIADADTAVKVLTQKCRLSENERNMVLANFLVGAHDAGQNLYGLANAVTYAAHATKDISYDRSTELEELGGRITAMPKTATRAELKELTCV